jgi:hypothetical protein
LAVGFAGLPSPAAAGAAVLNFAWQELHLTVLPSCSEDSWYFLLHLGHATTGIDYLSINCEASIELRLYLMTANVRVLLTHVSPAFSGDLHLKTGLTTSTPENRPIKRGRNGQSAR